MKNLLEDLYSDVLTAPTIEAFKVELIKFGKKLGFDLVIADYGSPPPKRAWTSIHNYPSRWWEQQSQFLPKDPVNVAIEASSRPILWNAEYYKRSGAGEIAEAFAPFGFAAGFDVPIHAANGALLILGFSRDVALSKDAAELVRVVAEAQLFSSFALPALDRLLAHTTQADFPKLTPKELEVLKWTIAGKTAFEVGAILSTTERTANFHVRNICEKLGVVNKNSAIAKAFELKIIV